MEDAGLGHRHAGPGCSNGCTLSGSSSSSLLFWEWDTNIHTYIHTETQTDKTLACSQLFPAFTIKEFQTTRHHCSWDFNLFQQWILRMASPHTLEFTENDIPSMKYDLNALCIPRQTNWNPKTKAMSCSITWVNYHDVSKLPCLWLTHLGKQDFVLFIRLLQRLVDECLHQLIPSRIMKHTQLSAVLCTLYVHLLYVTGTFLFITLMLAWLCARSIAVDTGPCARLQFKPLWACSDPDPPVWLPLPTAVSSPFGFLLPSDDDCDELWEI